MSEKLEWELVSDKYDFNKDKKSLKASKTKVNGGYIYLHMQMQEVNGQIIKSESMCFVPELPQESENAPIGSQNNSITVGWNDYDYLLGEIKILQKLNEKLNDRINSINESITDTLVDHSEGYKSLSNDLGAAMRDIKDLKGWKNLNNERIDILEISKEAQSETINVNLLQRIKKLEEETNDQHGAEFPLWVDIGVINKRINQLQLDVCANGDNFSNRIEKLESYPLKSGSIVFTSIMERLEKLESLAHKHMPENAWTPPSIEMLIPEKQENKHPGIPAFTINTPQAKQECIHDYGDLLLLSNPPKVKCIKCGFVCMYQYMNEYMHVNHE